MSTAFRPPTINRLQHLLTIPILPSRRLLLPRQTTTTSPFSTSRAVRNKPNTTTTNTKSSSNTNANNVDTTASGNPSYPTFKLRSIVPNPRVRRALMAVLGVMVVAESWMWITYWPRIVGWWKGEEGGAKE